MLGFIADLLTTALSVAASSGIAGLVGAGMGGGLLLFPFRLQLLPFAAGAGALVVSGAFVAGFMSGAGDARGRAETQRLKLELAAREAIINDLNHRSAQQRGREIIANQRAEAARVKLDKADAKISELNQMVDGLLDNPVVIDAGTARLLDKIGR